RLAPARMRYGGIDVSPEAIFGRLQRPPVALGPLVRGIEANDRLDRFETRFSRDRAPQRCALYFLHPLSVGATRQEGKLMGRLGDGEALDIGPGIPALLLTGRHRRLEESLHSNILGRR